MKTAGIICEFNPFHNGHKYLLEAAREHADAVICVMSGSFVQRGEAALYDKWERTRAALLNGADLVFELPVRYSLSSAQSFARGSVAMLDKTGVTDFLCFGCECGDIGQLLRPAELLLNEPPEISEKIKQLISAGESYPKARAEAYKNVIGEEILSQPNNILALEYLMACRVLNSDIVPIAVKRHAVGHHGTSDGNKYASATHLRGMIRENKSISGYAPYDFSDCIEYDTDRLTEIFKYKLITNRERIFDGICDAEPGLAERFLKYINEPKLSDIIENVKTKRYTYARLRRIVLCSILNIRGGYKQPEYLRILGMNTIGKQLLAEMRKKSALPIINKAADFQNEMFDEDIAASDIAALCADKPVMQKRDYFTSPVIV